jgi:hypothetical protein
MAADISGGGGKLQALKDLDVKPVSYAHGGMKKACGGSAEGAEEASAKPTLSGFAAAGQGAAAARSAGRKAATPEVKTEAAQAPPLTMPPAGPAPKWALPGEGGSVRGQRQLQREADGNRPAACRGARAWTKITCRTRSVTEAAAGRKVRDKWLTVRGLLTHKMKVGLKASGPGIRRVARPVRQNSLVAKGKRGKPQGVPAKRGLKCLAGLKWEHSGKYCADY